MLWPAPSGMWHTHFEVAAGLRVLWCFSSLVGICSQFGNVSLWPFLLFCWASAVWSALFELWSRHEASRSDVSDFRWSPRNVTFFCAVLFSHCFHPSHNFRTSDGCKPVDSALAKAWHAALTPSVITVQHQTTIATLVHTGARSATLHRHVHT